MPKTNRKSPRSLHIRSGIKLIRYQLLRCGDWGVRVEGYLQNMEGQRVTFSTRSGKQVEEVLGKPIWRGVIDSRDVGLYHIKDKEHCTYLQELKNKELG